MALATGTHFEVRATATTGNVNGAGFNPANANFFTDLTTDSNTANTASPVVSSASYNFVAGDVNAWLYISAGTNWLVGWYQIASVAANKATLSAAIGAGVSYTVATKWWGPSTVIGVASVGTPTAGTFGIDYSQQDTAQATNTNITCTAASTTVTSASAPFTRMMVGNYMHLTALTGTGALTGWYEIVNYTDASNVVLDRTPTNGANNITAGTFYVGGAGRLNALEDAFLEILPADAYCWVKSGTYTFSGAVSISSTTPTAALPSWVIGFTSLRGDTCTGSNRPIWALGANSFNGGAQANYMNLNVSTTAAGGFSITVFSITKNMKILNSSSTASRSAFIGSTDSGPFDCELISQNGTACAAGSRGRVIGCYIHDSLIGITASSSGTTILNNVVEACDSKAINLTNASQLVQSCTIYGTEAKLGTGIDLGGLAQQRFFNNIIYGFVTGVTSSSENKNNLGLFNNYFNNTTDATNSPKSNTDLALNPTFTGATQLTGTTATSSGSVLTQAAGDFSTVTDNVDFLHVVSGTGVTTGVYLITSHTSTTLTVNNALGTSVAGNIVYFVPTGHNFQIGTNLKAVGYPSMSATGMEGQNYIDIGAHQRQETASGASGGSYTFCG